MTAPQITHPAQPEASTQTVFRWPTTWYVRADILPMMRYAVTLMVAAPGRWPLPLW